MTDQPVVWVVDDDPDDQLLMAMALRQIVPSIQVRFIDDGSELILLLNELESYPRLVILDLNMPVMNGFETLEEIRNIPQYQHLPVVILTTSRNAEDKERSMALGANGYYTKPANHNQTINIVSELVRHWQLHDSAR
ncbi:response regulator [Fibrisoma montanum]|uniref:Response regulator n=1 Tax=Fibrisoma montanum TaxID=2305895 RepID=A0A418MJ03_9BACT|nr:response regulator [Fibrisoma montanum]RIV27376.1 response regulator [Fibrisoma montanum]